MRGRIRTKKKRRLGEKKRTQMMTLREREREELKDKSQRKQNVKKGIKYKLFGLQLFTIVLQCHHTFRMTL